MTELCTLTQNNNSLQMAPFKQGKVLVEGFAIHEGTFNDIVITKEELAKSVNSIVGVPVLKNHDNNVDSSIGKVLSGEGMVDPSNGAFSTYYTAEIDEKEEDLLRKMKLGFVSSTSIGFTVDHYTCSICGKDINECDHWFWDEGFNPIAHGIDIHELSIVAVPADADATVEVSFSKNDVQAFNKLKAQKEQRRTNMSKFEEKYNAISEEFAQFKIEKADEISGLKEEFKAKKQDLEAEMAKQAEETLSLRNEKESLINENTELKEKIAGFEEQFSKIEEERLAGLRAELSQLNKDVKGGLTEERIAEFEEASLNEFINVFSHQKEHIVTINSQNKFNDNYKQVEIDENAEPLAQLGARLGLKM